MLSTVEQATCKKVDGHLTIDPSQICMNGYGWMFNPYATGTWNANTTYSTCGGNTTT